MPAEKFNVSPNTITMMRKIVTQVVNYEVKIDEEGEDTRQLTEIFMELPSRKALPDYYEVITKPLDIKRIRAKIGANKYRDLDDLQEDFFQMCANAQTYNTEGSQIYEDSIQLQKVFMDIRKEIEDDYKAVKAKKAEAKAAAKAAAADAGSGDVSHYYLS